MKKNKGAYKRCIPYKRILCSLLAVIMTVSVFARPTVKAQGDNGTEPIALECSRLTAEALPEGNIVYMGTAAVTLDESDLLYTFPVYREGDLDFEARVEMHTVDMSALYGKDYELAMECAAEYMSDKCILESYMESVYASEGLPDEYYDALTGSGVVWEGTADNTDTEKGPLAQLKEEATGKPTRDTYQSESTDMLQSVVDSITPYALNSLDYSSVTILTFAPGESEKWVTFRLMDDNESEGTESFSVVLTDAVGVVAYELTSLSVSITDNEPTLQSTISFSEANYSSKGDKVTLKVKREDAEYSLVDMHIYTCEDTARPGVNYEAVDSTLAFMPYETEKEVELSVAGSGSFSVIIEDFTSCKAGERTETKVSISSGAPMTLASDDSSKSFKITLDGKTYTVEYTKGEPMGRIMDNTTPPLEVGRYYFSLPKENGGYYSYSSSQYSGDKPGKSGTLDCYYVTKDEQHNSYGDVAYYYPLVWKKGKVWASGAVNMPGVYYQYVAADWESTSSFGGGQSFRLNSTTLGLSSNANGKFGRTTSNGIIELLNLGDPNAKYNKMFHVSVDSMDNSKYLTPKSYLRFYGVAAMYKKYIISVSDPEKKSYLTGNIVNGVPETAMFTPAQVMVKCGAQTEIGSGQTREIYANPDAKQSNLVFSVLDGKVNGTTGKFGVLTGYKIQIGNDSNKVTVSYPNDFLAYLDEKVGTVGKCVNYSQEAIDKEKAKVNGKIDTIPYDAYFIDWIDTKQKSVADANVGYYQHLNFTPIFDYEKTEVVVLESTGGTEARFTSPYISDWGKYTFNAGDVLDLRVTCEDPGFYADGFEYSLNGGVSFDGPIRSSTYFQLLPGKTTAYTIRPAVALKHNRIELVFLNGAEDIFTDCGVASQGLIPKDYLKNDANFANRNILNLNKDKSTPVEMMLPTVGEVYSITFITDKNDDEYVYIPVITDIMTGKVYTTSRLDFKARNNADDNVLTVSYEKVAVKDMIKFTVSGTLVSNFAPIVSDGLGNRRTPVSNYTVSLPAGQKTVEMKETDDNGNETSWTVTLIDSVSTMSGEDGRFTAGNAATDSYVYGKVGHMITMTISNGSDVQVVDVVLNGTATDGWASTQLTESEIVYPYNAPAISSLTYSYANSANNNSTDENYNSIKIFDDTITFNSVVRNIMSDRTSLIPKLIFKSYDAAGTLTATYEAKNEDVTLQSGKFKLDVEKMNQKFENGERLRVSVVERITSVVNGQVVTYDVTYPEVDTGFVFYIENTRQYPKSYDLPEETPIEIPLLGASTASASTGLISFSKTQWGTDALGRVTGYTLSINADAMFNTSSPGSKEKVSAFNSLRNAAKQAQTNLNEVEAYGKTIENSAYAALQSAVYPQTQGDQLNLESLERQKKFFYANENNLKKDAKQPLAGFTKAKVMRFDVLFVLAFDFILNVKDDGTTEYVFCSGSVAIAGTANYSQSIYSVIYGVPVFVNFTGSVQADMIVSYPTPTGEEMFTAGEFDEYEGNLVQRLEQTTATFGVTASLMAQAGVGMCNVLAVRGYAKYGIQFSLPTHKFKKNYGVLLMASGGIGFDLLLLSINFDIGNFRYGFGIYEKMSKVSFLGGAVDLELKSASRESTVASEEGEVSSFQYSAGTADLSAFGYNGLIGAMPQEVDRKILLENAADRTRPQLVVMEDGSRMLFFIGNRGGDGELNSMALYYSVYKGGVWSQPQIVADDGTADTNPTVVQKDGKVYVAWADANRKYTEDDSAIDKLNALGITVAVYENGVMSNEYSLVDDEFFNFAPQINLVEDKLYCSYMKRDLSGVKKEEELLDLTAIYSTMAYTVLNTETGSVEDERFVYIDHPVLTDPMVLDYNSVSAVIDGTDYIVATYTVDEDGKLSTAEDRELFLSVTDVGLDLTFAPIQLTDDAKAQSSPKLTDINGIVYLTWIENGGDFCLIDVSDMLHTLFSPEASATGLHLKSAVDGDKDWYRKTASQLGIDNESYERTIYEELYNGNVVPEQANLQKDESATVSISDYVLVTNGDDIYIFYTAADSTDETDTGVELFGARYQRDMESEENSDDENIDDTTLFEKGGFGKSVKITDYGKVIDEFDLCMTENNDIYMVSNHFDQWIDENGAVNYGKNQLVEIKFSPRGSLDIVNDEVTLPANMSAGHTEFLSFTVENNGLLTTTGYDYTVSLIKDGKSTVIESGNREATLDAGETDTVEVAFNLPESTEGAEIEVTVTEHDVAIPNPTVIRTRLPYESSIVFTDTEIVWDGEKCYAAATVSNIGNKDADAYTASLCLMEDAKAVKTYNSVEIPAIKSGESTRITLPFSPRIGDFNHLGYMEMQIQLADSEGKVRFTKNELFTPCAPVSAEINRGASGLVVKLNGEVDTEAEIGPWSSVAGEAVYTTDDPSVATVDENGRVYGTGCGSTTLKVLYPAVGITDSITVKVTEDGEAPITYPPVIENTENGTVSLDNTDPAEGDKVTITLIPNQGYAFKSLTVTDEIGNEISLTANGNGTYSFIQPNGVVTVKAVFAAEGAGDTPGTGDMHTYMWLLSVLAAIAAWMLPLFKKRIRA